MFTARWFWMAVLTIVATLLLLGCESTTGADTCSRTVEREHVFYPAGDHSWAADIAYVDRKCDPGDAACECMDGSIIIVDDWAY